MGNIISDNESEITHVLTESKVVGSVPPVHHVIFRTVVTDSKEPPVLSRSNSLGWELASTTSEKVRKSDQSGLIFEGRLYTHIFIQRLD